MKTSTRKDFACSEALLQALYGLEGQLDLCRALFVAAFEMEVTLPKQILASANERIQEKHLEFQSVIRQGAGEFVERQPLGGDIMSQETLRLFKLANAMKKRAEIGMAGGHVDCQDDELAKMLSEMSPRGFSPVTGGAA